MPIVKLNNSEMDNRIQSLTPLLEHADMVGYAAARNYRRLQDQNQEYQDQKAELIKKYGKEEDGQFFINSSLPGWDEFLEELVPYMALEHEVEIYQIPMKEAMGKITGREIIENEWMFTEDEDA